MTFLFNHRTRMKTAYWLFKRGNRFYVEDRQTGKQTSLHTSDQGEAERLVAAKNEAANKGQLVLAVGQIYLNASDPVLMTRTWTDVMNLMGERGSIFPRPRQTGRRINASRCFAWWL